MGRRTRIMDLIEDHSAFSMIFLCVFLLSYLERCICNEELLRDHEHERKIKDLILPWGYIPWGCSVRTSTQNFPAWPKDKRWRRYHWAAFFNFEPNEDNSLDMMLIFSSQNQNYKTYTYYNLNICKSCSSIVIVLF